MDFASNTRNTRRLGAVGLAALFALLSGCFTEPVGVETGATGGDCDPGAFNCECVGGSCAPDLRCTESNRCITENCTPGTAICDCDAQGRCGPGLQCTSDVCLPQGGTTVTPTNTDSNSSTSTTGTSTTMPTDTMPSTTAVDTETSTTQVATDSESTSTGGPLACVDAAEGSSREEVCSDCFLCTNNNECIAEFAACDSIVGCPPAVQCLLLCAVSGQCLADCCEGEDPAFVDAALAVHNCREGTCSQGACGNFAPIAGFCGP